MSHYVCMRCSRQLLRQTNPHIRSISSSASNNAGYRSLSDIPPASESERNTEDPTERSRFGSMVDKAQANRANGPQIIRYTAYANNGSPPARLPDGTPRVRPRPSSSSGTTANPSRGGFSSRGRGGAPAGQLLIRRRAPSPPNSSTSQARPGGQFNRPQRGGASTRGRSRGARQQRQKRESLVDNLDPEEEAAIAEQIYGTHGVSKVALPYHPTPPSMADLQADWPNTPLSVEGLVGSVQQKAEVLAHRLPHGYISPNALASRFEKGELVRFESTEERDKVLTKATELAKERSEMLAARPGAGGNVIEPSDMSFSPVATNEAKEIARAMAQGLYPEPKKQRNALLSNIMRNLGNNGTYHDKDLNEFIGKVESLLPPPKQEGQQQVKRG